jgi:hypothetical protein
MSQAPTEGTLYVQAADHAWDISFVPNTPGLHGSTGIHRGEGEDRLRAFLQELGIIQEQIDFAFKELRLHGNVSIHPARLSPEHIQRYGL